jgi:predicted O-methyltransferase YrrM
MLQPSFTSFVLIALLCVASPGFAQSGSPRIDAVLRAIRTADKGQLAVSEADGRFLRLMVASNGTKRALEIGAASGYSAIWMGLGLRETGGRLLTIEYDKVRAEEALQNIKQAGLSDIVQVVMGDALKEIPKQSGPFDFVFIDAWKRDYQRYFELIFPKLERGGLLLAHNVVNKRDEMGDFLVTIQRHPDLLTTIVSPASEGMSVSYRRR